MDTVPKSTKRKPPKGASRKGIPNKVTAELKEMILQALDNAGGVEYLVSKAETHPQAFMALIGKVLPMTINGRLDGDVGLTVNIKHF
jgi:hypothetical protein